MSPSNAYIPLQTSHFFSNIGHTARTHHMVQASSTPRISAFIGRTPRKDSHTDDQDVSPRRCAGRHVRTAPKITQWMHPNWPHRPPETPKTRMPAHRRSGKAWQTSRYKSNGLQSSARRRHYRRRPPGCQRCADPPRRLPRRQEHRDQRGVLRSLPRPGRHHQEPLPQRVR
ncbi:hypothetical protein C8T65DRAFT_809373 [Cerioporus squamosus]|nr:hypothetical protein C8T65DRAFT_809373 [Cerioporus squamosus]